METIESNYKVSRRVYQQLYYDYRIISRVHSVHRPVATGRLPTFNELLVVPDGDALPNEKINLKHLYDLFKNTASHSLASMPFLGLLLYYFHDEHKLGLVKQARTELYRNLTLH